jgi:hypothetical protein
LDVDGAIALRALDGIFDTTKTRLYQLVSRLRRRPEVLRPRVPRMYADRIRMPTQEDDDSGLRALDAPWEPLVVFTVSAMLHDGREPVWHLGIQWNAERWLVFACAEWEEHYYPGACPEDAVPLVRFAPREAETLDAFLVQLDAAAVDLVQSALYVELSSPE